jgi:hypothetical protein
MITEAPTEKDILAALITAAGTGGVANLNTTIAVRPADMKDAFAKASSIAGQFRPAGK